MTENRAADLPASSVVATDFTVWMAARDVDEHGPRWDGLLSAECDDGEIDRLLTTGIGRVLQVGTGEEGLSPAGSTSLRPGLTRLRHSPVWVAP